MDEKSQIKREREEEHQESLKTLKWELPGLQKSMEKPRQQRKKPNSSKHILSFLGRGEKAEDDITR
jgi:hypothetical protein